MQINLKIVFFILLLLLFFASVKLIQNINLKKIDSFESCQKAGYPILDSYPERCQLPNGKTFIRKTNYPIVCTMEAKICPDGSYVGRVAPNCEFAPCPNETN